MLAIHTITSHVGCSYQHDQHNIYHICVHIHPSMESKQEYITNIINKPKHKEKLARCGPLTLNPGFLPTLADKPRPNSSILVSRVGGREEMLTPRSYAFWTKESGEIKKIE
jgi:hypothetical protein